MVQCTYRGWSPVYIQIFALASIDSELGDVSLQLDTVTNHTGAPLQPARPRVPAPCFHEHVIISEGAIVLEIFRGPSVSFVHRHILARKSNYTSILKLHKKGRHDVRISIAAKIGISSVDVEADPASEAGIYS